MSDDQVPEVIAGLNRQYFDPEVFKFENQCKICLMEYEKDDEITKLKCDERHYFHTECIIKWIEQGHNDCPFCR